MTLTVSMCEEILADVRSRIESTMKQTERLGIVESYYIKRIQELDPTWIDTIASKRLTVTELVDRVVSDDDKPSTPIKLERKPAPVLTPEQREEISRSRKAWWASRTPEQRKEHGRKAHEGRKHSVVSKSEIINTPASPL